MSKKDYKRGILEGRRRASRDVREYQQALRKVNPKPTNDIKALLAWTEEQDILNDAEWAAQGDLDIRLNKTKDNWKNR